MAIQIRKQLTKEQYIKLFSNPVSGIACQIEPHMISFENEHSFGTKEEELNLGYLKNIRYSKSMILKALYFWRDYSEKYYSKIRRIWSPLDHEKYIKIHNILMNFNLLIGEVESLPDTFLFSHRHIEEMNVNNYRSYGGKNCAQTNYLLNKKYNMEFRPQEQTMQHFSRIKTNVGIEFTIFPNEHPYITRDKISRVGMTEQGNVYIMMSKDGTHKK